MARWSGNKVDPSNINRGIEYENGDRLSREAVNSIVNNSIYASEKSDEALEKANSAFMGNGTIVRIAGTAQAFLDLDVEPEQVESVYDMYGDDSVNHGRFDGVLGGYDINLNLSKYKKLQVYCSCSGVLFSYFLDLTHSVHNSNINSQENVYMSVGTGHAVDDIIDSRETTGIYFSWSYVNQDKTKFYNADMGFTKGSQLTIRNDNSSYYVYKIEGYW